MKILRLSNGVEIEVNDVSTVTTIIIEKNDYADVDTLRSYITEDNLKNACLIDDKKTEQLINIVPVNMAVSSKYSGPICIHFLFREKTELEMMREELNALHAEQETQDAAIDYIAMNM